MKIFWEVTTRIIDQGSRKLPKSVASIGTIEAETKAADVTESTAKYDLYRNYFDTEKAARAFYKENKE
jgi:hypothetical protein